MTNVRLVRGGDGPLSGREAACLALREALSGRRFVNETLAKMRTEQRLDGREAALAAEIALGTIRRTLIIEHVLAKVGKYDPRRVKPELRAILLAAACQIIWMDRIPEFAAVDEAVELSRRLAGGRSPGMVNALLRNLTRAIDSRSDVWRRGDTKHVRVDWERACVFNKSVMPSIDRDGLAAYLAAATGNRADWVVKLIGERGPDLAEQVLWASQATPVTVLNRNTLRINEGVFHERVRAEFDGAGEWTADTAYLPATVSVLNSPLFQEGRAYIQDTTAREAALLCEARRGETILDFCAAPGGKSIALAQQIDDIGEIVACDASPDRILRVRENIRRLRLTSVRTHLIKTSDASESDLTRMFDAALVDAPCSNSGVFARRPEARLGLTAEKLASLVELQLALLWRAALSVRPGGRLVYSTCSIEPEENEGVVDAFLAGNPGWRLDTARTATPAWGPRLSDWRDGGFGARLIRNS